MSLETEEIYLINSTRIGGEIHKCIGSVNFNNTFFKTLDARTRFMSYFLARHYFQRYIKARTRFIN